MNKQFIKVTADVRALTVHEIKQIIDRLNIDRQKYAELLYDDLTNGNNETVTMYSLMCSTLTDTINYYNEVLLNRIELVNNMYESF